LQTPGDDYNYYNSLSYINSDDMQIFVMNLINNAFLSDNLGISASNMVGEFSTFLQKWGTSSFNFTAAAFSTYILFWMIPFAFSFMLPVYVHTIVAEKQAKTLEMMKIMGLGMYTYIVINILYFYMLYLIVMFVVCFMGLAFGLPFFTQTIFFSWLFLLLLWGMAQISLAFFLANVFNNQRVATIVSYFLVIVLGIVAIIVNFFAFDFFKTPTFWYMMIPNFAFVRGIWIICTGFIISTSSPLTITDIGPTSSLAIVFYYLIFETIIIFAISWYLYHVIPREHGVTYSPLFPIHMIMDRFKRSNGLYSTLDVHDDEFVNEDADCAEERRRVHHLIGEENRNQGNVPLDIESKGIIGVQSSTSSDSQQRDLVTIADLRKVFSGKVAVSKFCLGIQRGECFGLLGPNGAGKSTIIQMLCGLVSPSSGDALIDGVRISDQMHLVHQLIGFCPQHDVLWNDLTVEEHLLFYVRLKGVILKRLEISHVRDIIRRVGLSDSGFKKASELSGGMKRRLSIAISLVGDPSLILLDEPTTGLDPETRRGIWDVIEEQKRGRSIILTTHNMEEADVLCSRIGVMSVGQMLCLGSQMYLKNKFGKGYNISVTVRDYLSDPNSVDNVKRIMDKILPQDAVLESSFSGILSYQVDRESLQIGQFFDIMKTRKEEYGIAEWGINQTSLEEVFLRLIREDESTD